MLLRSAPAIAALLSFGCASAPSHHYARFADVEYGYAEEREIWSPRSGLWIHVAEIRSQGQEPLTPIVLVHPWGTNMMIWKEVAPKLAQRRRILLLDLPGHGKSGKGAGAYPMRRLAGAVIDAIDEAKIGRAIVVGNSIGGATAIEVGLVAPSRVEALVLIGAPGGAAITGPLAQAVSNASAPRNLETVTDDVFFIGWLAISPNMPDLARRMLDDTISLRTTSEWPAWSRATSASLREVVRYAPPVEKLAVPVLVIQGDQDIVVPPSSGETLAHRIPKAKLVRLSTCGHVPEVECPQILLQALDEFLRTESR